MRVDAVLQRNHAGVGADQRLDAFPRAFDVPQLDAEQHDIDQADLGGIVGGLGRHQMAVATRARYLQANALDGGQMRAACDEADIGPRFRQRHAKSTADPAGADNRNTHECSPELDVFSTKRSPDERSHPLRRPGQVSARTPIRDP